MQPSSSLHHLRIIAIGSDRMMAAVAAARHGVLKPYLNPAHIAIGSINSPMQCMMKEICAQCLQKHIDPETGEETYVYSCFNQDQPLDQRFVAAFERTAEAEFTAGKTHGAMDRLLPEAAAIAYLRRLTRNGLIKNHLLPDIN